MTPEGRIEAHLKKRVKATGGKIRKLRWVGQRGAPDRFLWWPGPIFALVEVKRPRALGGRLSGPQVREIARMQADGFQVFVVWSVGDVEKIIALLTQQVGCIHNRDAADLKA